MPKPKQRNHNEWFLPLIAGGRKSCLNCKRKLEPGETNWGWYEYIRAKAHKVKDFCKLCFPTEVQKPLLDHAGPCGCTITLCARSGHGPLPDWLTLEKPTCRRTDTICQSIPAAPMSSDIGEPLTTIP